MDRGTRLYRPRSIERNKFTINLNNMKRKFYLIELGVFFTFLLFTLPLEGQKMEVLKKIQNRTYSETWDPVLQNEKIVVYAKISDCSKPSQGFHFDYLLFKVENKTNDKIYVTWDFDYSYDNQPRHEESNDEVQVGFVIEPLKSVEASCLSKENRQLRLFVRDKNKASVRELTDFSINSLKISNL